MTIQSALSVAMPFMVLLGLLFILDVRRFDRHINAALETNGKWRSRARGDAAIRLQPLGPVLLYSDMEEIPEASRLEESATS